MKKEKRFLSQWDSQKSKKKKRHKRFTNKQFLEKSLVLKFIGAISKWNCIQNLNTHTCVDTNMHTHKATV